MDFTHAADQFCYFLWLAEIPWLYSKWKVEAMINICTRVCICVCMSIYVCVLCVCVYNKSRWYPFLRLLRALPKTLTSSLERNFFLIQAQWHHLVSIWWTRSIFLLEKKRCNPSSFFLQNMSGRKDFLICNLQLH